MDKNIYRSFSITPAKPPNYSLQHKRRKSQTIVNRQIDNKQQQNQENLLRNNVQETINKINEENNQNVYLKTIKWQLIAIQPKRTLKGLKCKIKWKHQLSGVYLQFRMIFLSTFTNTKWDFQGQVLLQIDQLNFQCPLQQERKIQQYLTGLLQKKPTQRKLSYQQEINEEPNWLRVFFLSAQKFLVERKLERKSKVKPYLVSKLKVNGNYIPYQSPVVFSWNPQGGYCLTQNKLVKNQRPFICTPSSFKNHISFSNKCDNNSFMIQENEEVNYQKQRQAVFIWDLQEDLDFIVKNSMGDEVSFINHKKQDEVGSLTNEYNPKSNHPNSQSFPLSQFPGQIKKLYSYLFGVSSHMDTTQHYDKLKVYSINNQIKSMQNHLLFIIYRLNTQRNKSIWEIVLQNQLPGYGSLFSTGSINEFKYLIIYRALKSKLSMAPEHNFSLRLKSIIIQNEHFHIELQQYFHKLYAISQQVPPAKLIGLGSFQHFDQHRAEELFIHLLKQVPAKNLYYRKQLQNYTTMKLYHKFNLFHFEINWLLTDQQRINFNKKIIPILWIRQRNCMKLQYKQLAKIINTNSMIIKFYTTMNGIIKKLHDGKYSFIQSIIEKHEEQKAIMEENMTYARRSFTIRCPVCSREFRTFQLVQLVDINANTKCKLCESKRS